MNNKNLINNNNNKKNIFDLTFNINNLPTYLIRKVLSYYYDHCLSMYRFIEKSSNHHNFTGYKLKFRWMDLCLVCKFWMEMVMPFLPNTFYFMDSQRKLETYLNLSEYGGTFPRRFLKPTLLRVSKPPPSLKKYPFHINSLSIYINRYQIPAANIQPSTIIPDFIYLQILKLSPDLKKLSFKTVKFNDNDLFNLLKTLVDNSETLNPLLESLNLDDSIFTIDSFFQLCKLIQSSKCTISNLSLNNCKVIMNNNTSNNNELIINQFSNFNGFIGSLKLNKSIKILKIKGNSFFNNQSSSNNINNIIMGGGTLELFGFIFSESTISQFEYKDTNYFLNPSVGESKKPPTIDYLISNEQQQQPNLNQISISLIIDGFLPLLENYISKSNVLRVLDLSNSKFENYIHLNNFLTSIQHSSSIVKINLSHSTFNINYSSNSNTQQHIQQIQINDDHDDDELGVGGGGAGGFTHQFNQFNQNNNINNHFEDEDNDNGDINNTNAFLPVTTGSFSNRAPEGWQRFSFLYGTQSLTSINLSSVSFRGDESEGENEMIRLFESLITSPQIKQLYLNRCGLGPSCLQSLTNFIRQSNSKLELLHLGKNRFGSSVSLLLMAFQLSKTLTDVDLSYNQLEDAQGNQIANFIKSSNLIRCLNISGSRFKLAAINQIGHALLVNKSLVSLVLSNIHMGMMEVSYIFDGIVSHPSISLLDLTNVGSNEMISSLIETSSLRCNVIY